MVSLPSDLDVADPVVVELSSVAVVLSLSFVVSDVVAPVPVDEAVADSVDSSLFTVFTVDSSVTVTVVSFSLNFVPVLVVVEVVLCVTVESVSLDLLSVVVVSDVVS